MTIRYLGVIRGSGVLSCGQETIGRVDYDIDGFLTRPGEVVASGEVRMSPPMLESVFGRTDLVLTTDDGRTLSVRFSGKRHDGTASAAHADISGALPLPNEWRRRA
jgi:hypothetical protein